MTAKHLLDYKFGWRWLLPVSEGDTVHLHGFSIEEEAFWHEALPAMKWGGAGGKAPILLVNADGHAEHDSLNHKEIENATAVCLVASRNHARLWRKTLTAAFPHVREYGLLPEANPRLVLPLASPRQTLLALRLHQPGRRLAWMGILLARLLARLGNFTLLRGRILLIASRNPTPIPQGLLKSGWAARYAAEDMDYALYLGTPDSNRKTTVLPLGRAEPDVILKAAVTADARASLDNEAAALAALSATTLADQVPRKIDMTDVDGTLTLYQEYRQRIPATQRQLTTAAISFLGGLARLNASQVPLADILSNLPSETCVGLDSEIASICRRVRNQLSLLAASGKTVLVHRSHGDFVPWNCALTERGLFVFDWEASRPQDLALSDAFHYAVVPTLLLDRAANSEITLSATLRFAGEVAGVSGIADTEVKTYLACWLLVRLGRDVFYRKLLAALDRDWP